MSVVLNSVVDSLDVRLQRHALPSAWFRSVLPVWQVFQSTWEPGDPAHYIQLDQLGTFRLLPSGRAPYTYVLVNPQICDIRIWNPGRWDGVNALQTGQFFVSFRSVFLQFHGLEGARAVLDQIEQIFCMRVGLPLGDRWPEFARVARADLACDTTGTAITWADLDSYRCRARKMDVFTTLLSDPVGNPKDLLSDDVKGSYPQLDNKGGDSYMGGRFRLPVLEHQPALREAVAGLLAEVASELRQEAAAGDSASVSRIVTHGRKPQSVYFGRFGSPLYARRYNKRGSLVVQDKLYMMDVWLAAKPDLGDAPVWRTEFSLSGDFLKRAVLPVDGVKDLRDLENWDDQLLADLWAYLTGEWLEHCEPSADKNVSRWRQSEDWRVIRSAFPVGQGVVRDHARRVPQFDKHLVSQAGGCMLTTVALRTLKEGKDEAMVSVFDDLARIFDAEDFEDRLLTRAQEMGLDHYTDTALTALFRSERLAVGAGS